MRLRHVYLLLFVVGTLLPLSQFVPWFLEHGLNIRSFFNDLFSNRIGGFFGLDVFVSALVLVVFVSVEATRLKMNRLWLVVSGVVAAMFCVGVSSGFPLFLYLRQRHIDEL